MIKKDQIYRHYKDPSHLYKIIALGKDTETLEDLVIYQALYKSKDFPMFQIWVRPLEMFEEKVNGTPRFILVEELDEENISIESWNDIKNQNIDQEAINKGLDFLNNHLK